MSHAGSGTVPDRQAITMRELRKEDDPALDDARQLFIERLLAEAVPRREIVHTLTQQWRVSFPVARELLARALAAHAEHERTFDRDQRRRALLAVLDEQLFDARARSKDPKASADARSRSSRDVVRIASLIADLVGAKAPRRIELQGKVQHGVDNQSVHEALARKRARELGADHPIDVEGDEVSSRDYNEGKNDDRGMGPGDEQEAPPSDRANLP